MKEKKSSKIFSKWKGITFETFFLNDSINFEIPNVMNFWDKSVKNIPLFKSKVFIFLKSDSNVYNESEFTFFICEITN